MDKPYQESKEMSMQVVAGVIMLGLLIMLCYSWYAITYLCPIRIDTITNWKGEVTHYEARARVDELEVRFEKAPGCIKIFIIEEDK